MVAHSERARIRIGVADDEPEIRRLVGEILTALGYQVCCVVSGGDQLVAACRSDAFDVALVDLDMPTGDGLVTAEEMNQLGVPTILMSGHADLREVVLEAEPFVAAVAKPLNWHELDSAIQYALRGRD